MYSDLAGSVVVHTVNTTS